MVQEALQVVLLEQVELLEELLVEQQVGQQVSEVDPMVEQLEVLQVVLLEQVELQEVDLEVLVVEVLVALAEPQEGAVEEAHLVQMDAFQSPGDRNK